MSVPWFTAHIVEYLQCLDGPQEEFMAWENIVLFEAPDGVAAWRLARERASRDATAEDEPLYLDDGRPRQRFAGRPARWVSGGVRKVIAVSHEGPDDVLRSGDEATYNTLVFRSEEEVLAFGRGERVAALYDENDDEGSGL